MNKVYNPLTGRYIKKGGKVHKKLVFSMYKPSVQNEIWISYEHYAPEIYQDLEKAYKNVDDLQADFSNVKNLQQQIREGQIRDHYRGAMRIKLYGKPRGSVYVVAEQYSPEKYNELLYAVSKPMDALKYASENGIENQGQELIGNEHEYEIADGIVAIKVEVD